MVSISLFDQGSKVRRLAVELIDPNPAQPRKSFALESIEELASSIRANGLLCPVSVRRVENRYQLIAGERRLMAFRLLGESHIPALIEQADDRRSATLAIVENLQRQQLNFYEEAHAIATLIEANSLTQRQAAEQLGLSQSAVANKLRLLRLPEQIAQRLLEVGATERHARALLPLNAEQMSKVVGQIIERQLTVAQTERLVESLLQEQPAKRGGRLLVLKDFRLFTNSIDRAVDLLKQAGVSAQAQKEENETIITYTISIPKSEVKKPAPSSQTPPLRSVL